MVEIAKTADGKCVRYVSSSNQTWLHARDICNVLDIKYQTKKFRDLMTRKFKTANKTFKKVLLLIIIFKVSACVSCVFQHIGKTALRETEGLGLYNYA